MDKIFTLIKDNATLAWNIFSFLLGYIVKELLDRYKERGEISIISKRINLQYDTFDNNGNRTIPLNGSAMLYAADLHLNIYNTSRRVRTVRNINIVGQVKGGLHFNIDFSGGKLSPSFVISPRETKEISIPGEFTALTDFLPFAPEDLTIEIKYNEDSGKTRFVQIQTEEITIIEDRKKDWQVF